MTDILIQFHALPEDLVPLLHWAVKDLAVHVTAFRFFPFQAEEIRQDMLDALFLEPSTRVIAFTRTRASLPAATKGEFLDNNSGALSLDIGRLSEKGLNESCLSCRTSDVHSLEVWKQIARKLKGITKAGATATSPTTRATSRVRNHRYTAGAKALDERGIPMLPVAGSVLLHFGEDSHRLPLRRP
jgi:hypothetical protein